MRNHATKAECFQEIIHILDQIDESTIHHDNELATFDQIKKFCSDETKAIKVKQERNTQKALEKRAIEGDKMRERLYVLLNEKEYKVIPIILEEILEQCPNATYSKVSRRLSDLCKMGQAEKKLTVYNIDKRHSKNIFGYRKKQTQDW